MRISNEIEQQLNQIADQPASAPSEVSVGLPAGVLQCQVAGCDRIGCTVQQVRLALSDQRHWSLDRMRTLADQLCKQLRYLVEPLQVIEVDSDQPLVQARSQPPSRDENRNAAYYELLIAPQTINLVRFTAPRGQPRQAIPMQLTREILARLMQDIADAVQGGERT